MSKRQWPAIFLAIIFIAALAVFFLSPVVAKKSVTAVMATAGFPAFSFEKSHVRFGSVTLENIKFDANGFSKAAKIQIDYSLIGALGGHYKNLTLEKSTFTGELDTTGKLTIAGWNKPENIKGIFSSFDIVTINQGNAEILSKTLGGISLNLEGQIRHHETGETTFQGNISGVQSQLSISAGLKARMQSSGLWNADLEIDEARLDRPFLRATRMNGIAKIDGENMSVTKFTTRLNAGAINLSGIPWQNVAIQFYGSPAQFKVESIGSATGNDKLKYRLDLLYKNQIESVTFKTDLPSFKSLADYLLDNGYITSDVKTTSEAPALLTIEKILGERYAYEIKEKEGMILRKGNFDVDTAKPLKENLQPLLWDIEH